MILKFGRLFRLTAFCLLLAIGMPLPAVAAPGEFKPATLKVVFTPRAFLGVNPVDVEAAFKVFAQTIGHSYGYNIQATVQKFESPRDFAATSSTGKPDLIIMDSWNYPEIDVAQWLEPLFVSSNRGEVANRYLLLAQRNGAKKLTDLRGKSLNLLAAANANLGIHWLRALFQEQNLGLPETFFGELSYHNDPIRTVLPVFFGKKDAALVDAAKFKVMAELNPQLNGLQTLATSEPLVNGIICLKRSGWPSERFRQDVIQAMSELHLNPAGLQILTLFKVQRLVPFEPSHLDTLRQLREKMESQLNGPGTPSDRPANTP